MTITEFCSIHKKPKGKIDDFTKKWLAQKHTDDFLGTEVFGIGVLGDLITGEGLRDQIPNDLFDAFHDLMGDKADNYDAIKNILVEKLEKGDTSVFGLVNKIKGQIGENEFLKQAGSTASLAQSGSQEAWDVVIKHETGSFQYIQVKMYGSADSVINQIKEVNEKLLAGKITDEMGGKLSDINFAVSSNIADEVKSQVEDQELGVEILEIETTAEEAKDIVIEGFNNVGPQSLSNFFGELFGATAKIAAMHALVNGFLLYKGTKDVNQFWVDTAESTAISGGGVAAGMVVETLFRKIPFVGGIPLQVGVLITSIAVRAYLKKIAERRHFVRLLEESNEHLEKLILKFEPKFIEFGSLNLKI